MPYPIHQNKRGPIVYRIASYPPPPMGASVTTRQGKQDKTSRVMPYAGKWRHDRNALVSLTLPPLLCASFSCSCSFFPFSVHLSLMSLLSFLFSPLLCKKKKKRLCLVWTRLVLVLAPIQLEQNLVFRGCQFVTPSQLRLRPAPLSQLSQLWHYHPWINHTLVVLDRKTKSTSQMSSMVRHCTIVKSRITWLIKNTRS